MTVKPMSEAEFNAWIGCEYILLCGYPASGKSHAILSVARHWRQIYPNSLTYIIDTEGGILKIWKKHFPELKPVKDILYYRVDSADSFVSVLNENILPKVKPIDLLCVESAGRIWEYSQSIGYLATAGMDKADFLEKRMEQYLALKGTGKDAKLGSPVVQPDTMWQVSKYYYARSFLDRFSPEPPCNIIITTTLAAERPEERESATRKRIKRFLGQNIVPDGAPRTAFYPDTVIWLTQGSEGFEGTILKDRESQKPGVQPTFKLGESFYLELQEARKSS